MRRLASVLVGLFAAVGFGSAVLAYAPADPADPPVPWVPWRYAAQLPYGPFESGATSPASSSPRAVRAAGFLTLPFIGTHLVTSIFDHCSPDYIPDGQVCRYDGSVARSQFGADWHGYPRTNKGKNYLYYDGHDGLDYSLYYEPVIAAAGGRVTHAGWDVDGCTTCEFGQDVLIDHGNGFTTRYGHLSRVYVAVGQTVRRGQVLGVSGNTGASTGEHLHFGLYHTTGMIPADPYGWTGTSGDPWAYDAGDQWLGGSPRFPAVFRPSLSASAGWAGGGRAIVRWGGAGPSGTYDVMVAADGAPLRPWLSEVGEGFGFYAVPAGHSAWFFVQARTELGWQDSTMTGLVTPPARPVHTSQA